MSQSDRKEKVIEYYSNFDEQSRLSDFWGQIEFVRTQNLISRFVKEEELVTHILEGLHKAGLKISDG